MKLENIKDTYLDIEQRFDVENWEIDGVKLWPFIRIENFMLLSFKALGAKPSTTRSYRYAFKIVKSKFDYLYARISDFKKGTKSKKNTDIVFLSDGMSYINLNDKWYNKFCDPIASEFSAKGFTSVRFDLSHNFYIPLYSPSIFIQPQIDNIIIKLLVWSKIVVPKFANEKWGDFEVFITDSFVNENFISIPSKKSIRKKIAKINKLKNFHIKKLKKINPKLGFVVNFYGDDQMAFTLACKELNIPTVDIQHGVQGPLHLSYGNWSKVPATGYTQMPNYFWVWSNNEKEAIDEWSHTIEGNNAVVVGNLFSQLWKDNASEMVVDFDRKFENLKKDKTKESVLMTLSPHTDSLMSETWEVIKKTQHDYNWFIRLHPGMVKDISSITDQLSQLGITQYEISESTRLPLQTILRNVDAHITCQSSCVIEAANFGVLSIITSEYGQSLYKDQIVSQEAFFVKKVDDIILELNSVVNKKKVLINDALSIRAKNKAIEELINKYLI